MKTIKLTFNKKEYNFSFGLGFIGMLLNETDLGLDEIVAKLNKNPFWTIPVLMFNSAKYSSMLDDKDIDFTQNDFIDWIDLEGGLGSKNVVKFLNTFTSSLTKNVPKEDEVEEGGVKKK